MRSRKISLERTNRGFQVVVCLGVLAAGLAFGSQDATQTVREAVLAEGATAADYLALAKHPALFEDRAIQRTLFRALRSPDESLVKAVFQLCFESDALLRASPIVGRRFENSFGGKDPVSKRYLLEVAEANLPLLGDLRVLALLSDALVDENADLSATALRITQARPELRRNPALDEALARSGSSEPDLPLPSFERFKSDVLPVLQEPGSDAMACIDCHKSRIVLRLPLPDEESDLDQLHELYYRSLLRVIDLGQPERSLLLHKPTKPEPLDPRGPSSPETHPGGRRFAPDSDTHRLLLDWIRSGMPSSG